MTLVLSFIVVTLIILTALLLAGRKGDEAKKMSARVEQVRAPTADGALPTQADPLLRGLEQEASGRAAALLRRLRSRVKLDLLLQQAHKAWSPNQVLLVAALLAVSLALLLYLVFHVYLYALLFALPFSYLPVAGLKILRNRRIRAFEKTLPDTIETMSRSLRAGHSLVAAISIIAEHAPEPARGEFGEVFRKQNFGLPLRDALKELLNRVPSQDLRVLVTGILLQKETGGDLTQILDRTSTLIRERMKLRGDIRVHTAQGRMTGWILCLLPIVMLFLINLVDPGYSRILLDDPFGRKLLYTGVGLLLAGVFLIRRIVNGIEV